MKKKRMAYVYHICRSKDKYDVSKGYIGVSIKPSVRMKTHRNKVRHQNPHLYNAMNKYDDTIIYALIYSTEKACYALEKSLRPRRNMGWNIAIGGSSPPSPKGTSRCVGNLPFEKRRKNYKASESTKKKISIAHLKIRKFHSDRMMGDKNPMYGVFGMMSPSFKGCYITPSACYFTLGYAAECEGISIPAIKRRCVDGKIIKGCRWYPKEMFGKLWSDYGWYFIKKEDILKEDKE